MRCILKRNGRGFESLLRSDLERRSYRHSRFSDTRGGVETLTQAEWARKQRATDTNWAQRDREYKRSERGKASRDKSRVKPEYKANKTEYMRKYQKSEVQRIKNRARAAVRRMIYAGKIIRPDHCELCQNLAIPLADGRSGLRADHFKGHEFPLEVRFVCVKCDGLQERERGNTNLHRSMIVGAA